MKIKSLMFKAIGAILALPCCLEWLMPSSRVCLAG